MECESIEDGFQILSKEFGEQCDFVEMRHDCDCEYTAVDVVQVQVVLVAFVRDASIKSCYAFLENALKLNRILLALRILRRSLISPFCKL